MLEGKALKEHVTPEEAFRFKSISEVLLENTMMNLRRGLFAPNPIETTCTEVRGELNAASTETHS